MNKTLFGLAFLILLSSNAIADDFRTWTDASGSYTIKAKLVSETPTEIVLEDEAGESFTVEKSKLSKADQDFLKQMASDAARNELESLAGPPLPRSATKGMNMDNAKQLALPINHAWKWNANPPTPAAAAAVERFDFGQLSPVWARNETGIALNASASQAVVSVAPMRNSQYDLFSFFYFCDLTTGDYNEKPVRLPESQVLSVSNGGEQLLAKTTATFDHELDVWSIGSGDVAHRLSWAFNLDFLPQEGIRGDALSYASFAGEDHVVSATDAGIIACWNLNDQILEWWCESDASCLTVSPDGKKMIVKYDNRLVCLSLPNGDCIGVITLPDQNVRSIAISHDETRCAVAGNGLIRIYDLGSGELQSEFGTDYHFFPVRKVSWLGNNHVVLAHGSSLQLLDVRLRCSAWEFELAENHEFATNAQGDLIYVAGQDRGKVAAVIQKFADSELMSELNQVDLNDVVAIQPGTAVRLEVDVKVLNRQGGRTGQYNDISKTVYADIEKKIRDAGWKIDNNSDICIYVFKGPGERLTNGTIRTFNGVSVSNQSTLRGPTMRGNMQGRGPRGRGSRSSPGNFGSGSSTPSFIVAHNNETWFWRGANFASREDLETIDRNDTERLSGFPFLVIPKTVYESPVRGKSVLHFDGVLQPRVGVATRNIYWETGHPNATDK